METNIKSKNEWWKAGLVMSAQVSSWILIPTVIAPLTGKLLDKHFHTAPWFYVIFMVVSFSIAILIVSKIAMKYLSDIEKEAAELRELKEQYDRDEQQHNSE